MKIFSKLFRTPCAHEVASRELEEAKLDLLMAEANEEHYAFMKNMLKERITRLEKRVMEPSPISSSHVQGTVVGS